MKLLVFINTITQIRDKTASTTQDQIEFLKSMQKNWKSKVKMEK